MLRIFSRSVAVAALLTGVAGVACTSHAAPFVPVDLAAMAVPAAEHVSFWGRPFPYGYAYRRGGCTRIVRVETPDGWRVKRIWVCRR